jgi:hypothetical protein
MPVITRSPWTPRPSLGRALGVVGSLVAWTVAGLAGLLIAATVTAVLVVAGVIGAAALAFTRTWPRRTPTQADNDDIIEARHVGGHTWVAYGFDHRG